jgi:hypothetical protein
MTKRLVRQAFASKLPERIIREKEKIGFATPFDSWMRDASLLVFVWTATVWRPFLMSIDGIYANGSTITYVLRRKLLRRWRAGHRVDPRAGP